VAFTSGEPVRTETPARWQRIAGNVPLINLYGATECGIVGALDVGLLEPGSCSASTVVPGANLYVADEGGRRVTVGEPGEISVGGASLAAGYWNMPALTAERFVPDPHADRPGDRRYRTGDIGILRHDGGLDLVGRQDQQVKVRGFRVELRDVETALLQCPGIRAAAVVPEEPVPGDIRLTAYVTTDSSAAVKTLRAALLNRLPAHMVPSTFVAIDAMPALPSGKLDRTALSRTAGEVIRFAPEFVPPSTPTEALLAAVWAEVLGVGTVGLDDDFFASGGHSLLVMKVLARLRHLRGVELPIQLMFDHPTVRGLAPFAERLAPASAYSFETAGALS
jgi:acyl-coenzyme A synthetase/AMP-(fatty) acid ligase